MSRTEEFFHGTVSHFHPGDEILPGHAPVHRFMSSPEHSYATTSEDSAWHYAELAWNWKPEAKAPRVYKVEPIGEYEDDDNSNTSLGDKRSKSGWRVLGELPTPEHWKEEEEE
jgi:hypothetical protein